MNTLRAVLLLGLLAPFVTWAQTSKTEKIEAYYFHNTSRCVTCKTVEAEAKQDIETLYPDLVRQGKMSFIALNLEEAKGKAVAEKLGISGQTLLLVKGNNKIDITNEGFLYARTNPAKLKKIIKEKVDGLLDL